MKTTIILIFAAAVSLFGQSRDVAPRAIDSGSSNPATCSKLGQLFVNTASTPVLKISTAISPCTWTTVASSGGVALISSGAFASRPSCVTSTNPGDVYYATDSPVVSVCGSSDTWSEFVHGVKRTAPPAASSLTWINQGGATAVDANGGILVTIPHNASDALRLLCKSSYPTPPFTFTVGYLVNDTATVTDYVGPAWSDGTKVVEFISGYYNNGSTAAGFLAMNKYTNTTTFSALVKEKLWYPGSGIQYKTITDDNTNMLAYAPTDPYNPTASLFTSIGRTSFLTPSKVCMSFDNSSGVAITILILDWRGI